ncbi:MAG: DUF2442 domain-containing protein [Planctomycetes bacterium]|nr:DUF2442 domain-containing protein [Planctomycetota bacterium]NUQ34164.1 DUF2442 domain-containing protein [Planctomycetaceae bacterium]
MLNDVVKVEVLDGYKLRLTFEDGVSGVVDVAQLIPFEGVFTPLKNRGAFANVSVNPELGTVEWACGVDLDPVVLYSAVAGTPLPT